MALNHAPGLSVATALFFVWTILTFTVRAWVKLRRSENWGWDDTAISGALLLALLHVISIFWSVSAGNGQSVTSLEPHQGNLLETTIYASEIFYVCSVGLVRISSGLFIARLTRFGRQAQVAYVLIAVCAVWLIASILAIALRGDFPTPWATLDGSQPMFVRWVAIEVTGLAMEFALWGLCVQIIWTLSMPMVKRISVLAIFGCRLLLVPIVALRLVYLSPRNNPDPGTTNMSANILTEAALNFAIMSACVTCLKPFLKPFHSEWFLSDIHTEASWPATNSKSHEAYYKLSAMSQAKKDLKAVEATEKEINPSQSKENGKRRSMAAAIKTGRILRPDRFDQRATVSAPCRSSSGRLDFEEMQILKTETWSVRIEENQHFDREKGHVGVAV